VRKGRNLIFGGRVGRRDLRHWASNIKRGSSCSKAQWTIMSNPKEGI